MRQNKPSAQVIEPIEPLDIDNPEEMHQWTRWHCKLGERERRSARFFFVGGSPMGLISRLPASFAPNWADTVPEMLNQVVALLTEKRKQELRFNLLQVTLSDFDKRIHKLECAQTKIIPVDSFIPEPYAILRPIFVSVNSIEGGFNAGWYDVNIHSSGDTEEEAVSNLKSLILDIFDSLSNEPSEKLGPEPTRQLAILRHYIQKGT